MNIVYRGNGLYLLPSDNKTELIKLEFTPTKDVLINKNLSF